MAQGVLNFDINKNNIPSSGSDAGAEGHGTVVFAVVTTVPCSGRRKNPESPELFEGLLWPERWNVVTTRYFETFPPYAA